MSLDVHGLDELMAQLNNLSDTDGIAQEMMDAGMEVLQEEVVAEASKHVDTGEMAASIKPTGLQISGDGGYYMCTRPTGYATGKRKWKNAREGKGEGVGRTRVRNMEKMVWLEYGVKGRPATPVISAAVIRAEPGVVQAMKEAFERKVGSL